MRYRSPDAPLTAHASQSDGYPARGPQGARGHRHTDQRTSPRAFRKAASSSLRTLSAGGAKAAPRVPGGGSSKAARRQKRLPAQPVLGRKGADTDYHEQRTPFLYSGANPG